MKAHVPFYATAALGLLVLLAAAPSIAQRSCPPHLSDEPCFIDLQTGKVTGSCAEGAGAFYLRPPEVNDSDKDGWGETVVQVSLTDECTQACVVLDYAEPPTGFTLDVGDSVTNNGHGGNAGTGESEAELQIFNDRLTLFSRSYGPGLLDRVAESDLQLENGAYKVCVSDQYASFGQPISDASTPNGRALFALPDPFNGNSDIFIGLNRVIAAFPGVPSLGRVGTGLQRAYITIE